MNTKLEREQSALDKYNANYRAAEYDHVAVAVRNCVPYSEQTNVMNLVLDAAMEKCGHPHYVGSIALVGQTAIDYEDFDQWLLGSIDLFLMKFS